MATFGEERKYCFLSYNRPGRLNIYTKCVNSLHLTSLFAQYNCYINRFNIEVNHLGLEYPPLGRYYWEREKVIPVPHVSE